MGCVGERVDVEQRLAEKAERRAGRGGWEGGRWEARFEKDEYRACAHGEDEREDTEGGWSAEFGEERFGYEGQEDAGHARSAHYDAVS